MLVVALAGVAFIPLPGSTPAGPQAACQGRTCRPAVSAQRWTSPLPGAWAVGAGPTGTVPVSGQAYVAVGDSVAVVGEGLTVEAYGLRDGQPRWKVTLTEFPPGSAIMSVRAWTGVVTVGVAAPAPAPATAGRTEVVIDSVTGVELRRYPAALFGGAVAASASATTVIGPAGVISYDNGTGAVRWRRHADPGLTWRADSTTLYLAQSAGGSLRGAPVTGLRVIDLISGAERALGSPAAFPFTGSLAAVVGGIPPVALFSSAGGITAYNGSTGAMLWSMRSVVPEGTDPAQGLLYLTSATGALLGVDPLTGEVRHSVSGATAGGSAGMYVVRGGVALGLDNGASGEAWGYSLAAGRVTWTAPGLPWPHYFADISGVGGSAATAGNTVVIAACQRLAPPPAASATPTATPASASMATSPASSAPGTATSPPAATARASHASTGPATHPVVPPSAGDSPSSGSASYPAVPPSAGGLPSSGPASYPAVAPASAGSPASASAGRPPTVTPPPAPSPPQLCANPVLVALSI